MILNDMQKWMMSPKTRYIYQHFGFGCHSKIDAVITLFQCKYHLNNIQCVKTAFSASETTILLMWLYLLRTPVYLMSIWCAYMKLRRIPNFHFKRLYLANICVYYSFRDDFECYGKMADIAKNAVCVPSFRVWQTFEDWRSHTTVSVQISPPQYSMCKSAFSASETTILPMWLYLLRIPVYLMSL